MKHSAIFLPLYSHQRPPPPPSPLKHKKKRYSRDSNSKTHTHTCMHTHMHTYTHMHTNTHTHMHTHARTHANPHIQVGLPVPLVRRRALFWLNHGILVFTAPSDTSNLSNEHSSSSSSSSGGAKSGTHAHTASGSSGGGGKPDAKTGGEAAQAACVQAAACESATPVSVQQPRPQAVSVSQQPCAVSPQPHSQRQCQRPGVYCRASVLRSSVHGSRCGQFCVWVWVCGCV